MKSNSGTQFYQQDRIYGVDENTIAMCHPANIPEGSYRYMIPMAICIDDLYADREPRYYVEECPTLRSGRSGLKVQKIGTVSPTSLIGGTVYGIETVSQTIMSGCHGYAQGYLYDDRFLEEDDE